MVAPELERVARDAQGRYVVVKVNTEELREIASRFRIRSIPTLAVLYRGREIQRASGARSAADILAFVSESLAEAERRVS
jgi:thioredoxin 2